jgi:Caspase domain
VVTGSRTSAGVTAIRLAGLVAVLLAAWLVSAGVAGAGLMVSGPQPIEGAAPAPGADGAALGGADDAAGEDFPEPDPAQIAVFEARIDALRQVPPLAASTGAGGRHALVIGNDAYDALPKLTRSVSDAASVGEILKGLGFEVTLAENLDLDAFDDRLDAFYAKVETGDIAAFFFAGHGMADGEVNYLIPTDMPEVGPGENPRLSRRAIDAGGIVDAILARGADLAFVVLDACREDPFPKADTRAGVKLGGLSRMEPARGAFVIYSAGIGQTALDRLGPSDGDPNSVFTRKFGPILETPGMPLAEIAKRTQIEVGALARTVNHPQAPAYYDQVIGNVFFATPRPKLFGLTIGIDDYGDIHLEGAVNDAELITAALEQAGATEVVEILDQDARFAYIDFAWRTLVDKASPGDTLVFAYSGASAQLDGVGGAEEADGADEFLALAGFDPAAYDPEALPPDQEIQLGGDILLDNELTEMMEMAAAKNLNVVLLVDGCDGGGLLDREFANISFLGGTTEGGVVYEVSLDDEMHGAMSYAFAEALMGEGDLNGDGQVTQAELFADVAAQVYEIVGPAQEPQFFPALDDASPSLALTAATQ